MIELFKNIGLGIFVNGAFAWQFSEVTQRGFLAMIEGIVIMALAIYIQKKGRKMTNQDIVLIAGALIIAFLVVKIIKLNSKKPTQH